MPSMSTRTARSGAEVDDVVAAYEFNLQTNELARHLVVRAFPSAMLSTVGTHESWRKEVHRPATSTHKWWAKRLGSVFRGIITAAVTAEGDDATVNYQSPTRLAGTVILDLFAGSGVV